MRSWNCKNVGEISHGMIAVNIIAYIVPGDLRPPIEVVQVKRATSSGSVAWRMVWDISQCRLCSSLLGLSELLVQGAQLPMTVQTTQLQ